MRDFLIPRHGGYRKLKTFQLAQLIYDITVRFCDRYTERRSRTHDQMVQAARSARTTTDGHRPSRNVQLTPSARSRKSVDLCVRPCPPSAELVANAALSLINLCSYLLDRQLGTLATDFTQEGGFTERLYRIRKSVRGNTYG